MRPDNKLQLNCHNEAAQNAKETSKYFTQAPSVVAEIVPLWSIFSLWVQMKFLLICFWGVCSLHQEPTGGEVTGVKVSAKEVIGGGVGDSIPQADSSLSISWRDPNCLSDGGTHSRYHLNSNCHRETSKSSPWITINLAVPAESENNFRQQKDISSLIRFQTKFLMIQEGTIV